MSTATRPVRDGSDPVAQEEPAKGGRLKLVVVLVVVLAALGGAAYWFLLKPGGGAEAAKAPEPGIVTPLDPIQINLTGDHYLKLGIALQASKDAGEEDVDGSKALDAAIEQFSGRDMVDLAKRGYRERMRHQLERTLAKEYDGKVIGVYFTDFVSQ